LTGSEEFHREIFNLLKEFTVEYLDLGISNENNELLKEMMVDSYLHDLIRSCKALRVNNLGSNITPEVLHKLCKSMNEGGSAPRFLSMMVRKRDFVAFLKLIGIICRDRDSTFFSNRAVELYKWDDNDLNFKNSIFDGKLEIILGGYGGGYRFRELVINLHDSSSLQNAKNREKMTRIVVSPE
ncbi:hypothetical protein PENTCL1PPCAC_19569, partial [Pristionchus entomophagus]